MGLAQVVFGLTVGGNRLLQYLDLLVSNTPSNTAIANTRSTLMTSIDQPQALASD